MFLRKIGLFQILILLVLLGSCRQNYGNKLESDQLDVFFAAKDDEELARKVGQYWKSKDLIGTKKQFIRLEKKDGIYYIQLIPSTKFSIEKFSFDERSILKELQDDLQKTVFGEQMVHIVLADNQFNTLYDINN